jgi:hypothetical protein
VVLVATLFLSAGRSSVLANPVGDFFKRLGNSIAHPHSSPSPAPRHSQKKNSSKKPGETPPPAPSVTPQPALAPTNPPLPTPTPALQTVRTAAIAPATKGVRRDIPYGIPVPNKPGLVTSPYSPKSGYVDVRGFPSGTEVKDPYTGKIFLTP